jgi:hypothetical protein
VGDSLFIFTAAPPHLHITSSYQNSLRMVYVYNIANNEMRLLINNLSNPSDTSLYDPTSYGSSSSPLSFRYDISEEYLDVCPSSIDQKEALVLVNSLPQQPPPSSSATSQNSSPSLSYCDRVQLESYGIQKMGLKWCGSMFSCFLDNFVY